MKRKILIVDQSKHYVEMVEIRLHNYGYDDIKSVSSAIDALEVVESYRPNLILVDTRLSDMDGYRLTKRLKELHGDQIKVILMNGLIEQYNMGRARLAQADEYVVKTFDCLLLMAAINKTFLVLEGNSEHLPKVTK